MEYSLVVFHIIWLYQFGIKARSLELMVPTRMEGRLDALERRMEEMGRKLGEENHIVVDAMVQELHVFIS